MALEAIFGKDPASTSDEFLVDFIKKANTHSVDVHRITRRSWDSAWATYNNNFDISKKAEWQSKAYLPKFKMAVRGMRSILKQSIIKSNRFFALKGSTDEARDVEKDIEDTLLKLLDQVKFKQKAFGNGVFLGLLENLMNFKIYPVPIESGDKKIHPNQTHKFLIIPVSSYDFKIDPRGRKKYVIHRVKMDLSDYRKLVDAGVYSQRSLLAAMADFENAEEEHKERVRRNQMDVGKPEFRKEVELWEYWGDVSDSMGNMLHENATFTVLNEKAIARLPKENPFNHKGKPFVWGPLFEKFGSVYHEGFGDSSISLARLINENLQVMIDANLTASMRMFEVNLDLVHNPGELRSGFYPGKVVKTRGAQPGQQAVREYTLGEVNASGLQMQAMYDREFQNATGFNEFIGAFTSAGGKTATEVKTKTSQSAGFLQAIAEDIEDNVLEPMVEMLYSLVLQYNPEVFGLRANSLPVDVLRFEFAAKGISKIIAQQEEFQNMMMWANMMRATPLNPRINWDTIARRTAEFVNLNPDDLLLADQQDSPVQGQGMTRPDQDALAAEAVPIQQALAEAGQNAG